MKIIISGANGFLGSSLAAFFEQKNFHVIPIIRQQNIYTPEAISSLVAKTQPDVLIHAAGPASVSDSYVSPTEVREGSVELTRSIIEGVRKAGTTTRFVHFSSAAVYGSPERLPIAEDAPLKPISPYGELKLECERLVDNYVDKLAVTPLTIRIFSLFGERQHRLVLYELFQKFSDPDSSVVNIRGTGQETRDFLSIDVFCQKLLALIEQKPMHSVVNVASGETKTILQAAQIMGELLGKSSKTIVCSGEKMEGNPACWQADTTLYDQIVSKGILFDFVGELAKTLAKWKTLQKT